MNEDVPSTLADAGAALWTEVTKAYDLRADELAVLSSACKAGDRAALVDNAWQELGRPMLTKGSMGQEIIYPLFAEMQKLEAHQATLLARLKLPDEGGERPNQQRDAAQSRWAQRGAAG